MSEVFTKSQLESKKVVDLKNLAESYDINTSGMKKPQIVEAILEYQEDLVSEPEIEEIQEVEAEEIVEESEIVIDDIKTENLELEVEDVPEAQKVKVFSKYTKTLTKPQMLYKDEAFTDPIANIIGLVEVIGENNGKLHVNRVVSGRGVLTGYINK